MHIANQPLSIGQSRNTIEWQPTLFETPATMTIRMELEMLKQSNTKMRKALFAQDNYLMKELECLSGIVCDLAEAYMQIKSQLDDSCKADLH